MADDRKPDPARIREVVDSHPDDQPPTRELKDIALQSAGAAATAERRVGDLASTVGTLTAEVSGLRGEVAKAVQQDELRRSERHTRRVIFWPMVVGALALVVIGVGVVTLTRIAQQNQHNGDLIINCTTPPQAHPTAKELKAKECYTRGQTAQADAIRQLNCVTLLAHGQVLPMCEDVRKQLAAAGVKFPGPG